MAAGYQVIDPAFADFIDVATPPERLADGFTWTEGPVWLNDALYFNDIPAKKMHRWNAARGLETALENSAFANGATLDLDGRMISCEHGGRRVVRRIDPADLEAVAVVADRYEGRRLNSPNDVVVRADGSVWFTDPPYGINSDVEGYPAESEVGGNFVFCVPPGGAARAVATDFDKPNGLAFSPDETRLYIADSGAVRGASFPGVDYDRPHHIRVFDVLSPAGDKANGADFALTNGRVFAVVAPGAPDGLRVDADGFVWTSAFDGVQVYAPNSMLIGKILLPAVTANLCFGGESGTDLYITASDAVWRVRTTRTDAARAARAAAQ